MKLCCQINGKCRHTRHLHKQGLVKDWDNKPDKWNGHMTWRADEVQEKHACKFRFCDACWQIKLQHVRTKLMEGARVYYSKHQKPYSWDFNRLCGDGSTWVPRWGTMYAAQLITTLDSPRPRRGREFSSDGTTATNLRMGGFLERTKEGFVVTEKGRLYIKTKGEMV